MKIIYCIAGLYNSGGMERILTSKVNYLIEHCNYNVIIITTDQKNRSIFYPLNEKVKHIDLELNYTDDLKYSFFKRVFIYLKKQFKHKKLLKDILKKENPEIIVSLGNHETFFLPNIVNKNIKTIREHHFNKNFRLQEIPKNIFYKLKFIYDNFNEKKTVKKYNEFIVLTEEDRKQWNNNKMRVIYNFLDCIPRKNSNCKNKKIISVGRLEYQKGFDILIDVWKKVDEKHSDWVLEIYGEGSLRKELQDKIDSLNLTDSLILKGSEKNIQSKYLESSIYMMSSRYEGMPMVLLEAMSCGLPLVSFDCPCGPKDIIKDGENGFLVKFGNIEEMAKKINYLIENEDKRIDMGKKAKELSYNYLKEKIMNQWKELFENLSDRS